MRFLGLLLFVVLLSGCATGPARQHFVSDVDAISSPEAVGKKLFVIVPGNQAVSDKDLQFTEFKALVEKAMVSRGFIRAHSLESSEFVVLLSYGVGAPETRQYTYDVPVWTETGFYYPYRRRFYPGFAGYSSIGVTGYSQRTESYVSYRRNLLIDAHETQAYLRREFKQLWKVNAESQGRSNDLRLAFPYMLSAAIPYLGSNTGHMLTIDIDEENPVLRDLTGPFVPPPSTMIVDKPQ